MTIKAVSEFTWHYIVNRPATPTSSLITKIKKTCENCWEVKPLAYMTNGWECCKECSEDIESLTNRANFINPFNERN